MLFTTDRTLTRAALQEAARRLGLPELAVPRLVVAADALPVLGIGKVDYVTLERMAQRHRPRDREAIMTHVKIALWALLAAAVGAVLAYGPVAQPASYHAFADARPLGVLPNWQNVLSNLVFLAAGVLGAAWCAAHRELASPAWRFVFYGAAAVFVGSGWYHLEPNDAALVWDRIPMAVAFMAYLVALLGDYVDERVDMRWLYGLAPLGIASVMYWYVTGDLRPWIVVQGFPVVATPLVLLLSPRRYGGEAYLWLAVACYVAAKAAEAADAALYELTGAVLSGHAAKHVLAGIGVLCFWRMLAAREAQPAQRRMQAEAVR